MNVSAESSLSERLALILDGLCRAVAARVAGGALAEAVIILIWERVRRAEGRLLGLLARFRAGRAVVRVSSSGRGSAGVRRALGPGLPRGFGWLLPLVPVQAAGYASQLRAVLADAEVRALLASVPQARRVLAPVCRMLGIEAEVLGPVAAGVVRVKRVPERPAARVLVPPGVLAAVRRQGFGKRV